MGRAPEHGPRSAEHGARTTEIIQATSPELVEKARELFQEYERSLGIDLCFQGFAQELASLPGRYAPPDGRLLLTMVENAPAGCVALRRFSNETAEMKRLYVRPAFRGLQLGRGLVDTLLQEARAIGYEAVVLDTLPMMVAAISLYRSLGFRDTDPYRFNPVEGTSFMRLNLS